MRESMSRECLRGLHDKAKKLPDTKRATGTRTSTVCNTTRLIALVRLPRHTMQSDALPAHRGASQKVCDTRTFV
jgi:hypothetical protein